MRLPAALVALALALALAGCSGKGDDVIAATAPAPAAQAHTGGELRVAITRPSAVDPALLDPSDTSGALVVRTMCDPLVGTDPDSRELAPAIAARWQVLARGGSVQLRLRHGVRFSDGSRLTAQDVAATLQRVIDPATVSPTSELLRHVLGYQQVQENKVEPRALAGVKVITDDTVQVSLDGTRDAQFVGALTIAALSPVPREAAGRAGFAQRPICVGPYRLAAPYTGTEPALTLARVTGYTGLRPGLTRGGAGWPDRITFTVVKDRAEGLRALRAGRVDASLVASSDAAAAAREGLEVVAATQGRLEYVGLPRTAPFDDPRVRAALSAALDRERINREAFGGGRQPALTVLPVTVADSLLPEGPAHDCGLTPTGDVSRARDLLRGAGVDLTGKRLPFYFNDEFDNRRLVQAVAAQWKAAFGLVVVPRPSDFESLLARGAGATGFDGAFRMAAVARYPDVGAFVLPLISRDGVGSTNLTGYDGAVLEQRIQRQVMEVIPAAEQQLALSQLAQALCTLPTLPIAWYRTHLALGPKALVAGNGAVDAGAALPELRELAVR